AVAVGACPLPVLLEKFRQLRLRYAKMHCSKRAPNLFAVRERSGIIASRFVANEILEPRFLPCFARFFPFHRLTVEHDREKCKQNLILWVDLPSKMPA